MLFYPGNELADISNHHSGHRLSAKFSSTSGNSTAQRLQVWFFVFWTVFAKFLKNVPRTGWKIRFGNGFVVPSNRLHVSRLAFRIIRVAFLGSWSCTEIYLKNMQASSSSITRMWIWSIQIQKEKQKLNCMGIGKMSKILKLVSLQIQKEKQKLNCMGIGKMSKIFKLVSLSLSH